MPKDIRKKVNVKGVLLDRSKGISGLTERLGFKWGLDRERRLD
jgi:hypothetical protein